MPCLLGCTLGALTRGTLFIVWLSSDWLEHAYETKIWPFLGFFLLPVTTLAYAWTIHEYGSVDGRPLGIVLVALAVDLGLFGAFRIRRRPRGGDGSGGGGAGGERSPPSGPVREIVVRGERVSP